MEKFLEQLKNKDPRAFASIAALILGSSVVAATIPSINKGNDKGTNDIAQLVEKYNKAPLATKLAISENISPTFSQRDNYTMPHRTCNSSSNAMFLNFYRVILQTPQVQDNDYLRSVLKRGDTIYHEVQTSTLEAYGLESSWYTNKDFARVKKVTSQGFPVVVNILHRGSPFNGTLRGGHIIVLRSYDFASDKFAVSDPYGVLESNYTDYSTFKYFISGKELFARWQGGYRLLSLNQSNRLKLDKQ